VLATVKPDECNNHSTNQLDAAAQFVDGNGR
jgi:hypothetical protein